MTPEEHQLISGLFERMRAQGPVEKDRDAEGLIIKIRSWERPTLRTSWCSLCS